MTYALRPSLHGREIEDHVFFLNLPADRYFCLKGSAARAFLAAAHGDVSSEHAHVTETLLDCGLILYARERKIPPPCSIVAVTGKWPAMQLRPSDIPHALVANASARKSLRISLELLITSMARRKSAVRLSPAPETQLGEITALIRFLDWIFSGHDLCLPRAAAILTMMLRKGVWGDLVIGLSLHPSRAHAWVQVGDRVIGDRADIVALYAPILAI